MTEPAQHPIPSHDRRRGRSLHRTVLSITVAAVMAAALPFSVFYVNAVTHPAVSSVKAGVTVRTTSSGSRQLVASTAPASSTAPVSSPAPIRTRTS